MRDLPSIIEQNKKILKREYEKGFLAGTISQEKKVIAEFIQDIQDMDRTYIDDDEALNKVIKKWEERGK